MVLAQYLADLPPIPTRRILEIGAGGGAVSIIACAFGHDITMTEYDEHALAFAKANAMLNGCEKLSIQKLDWHNPTLSERFHIIIGSEVIYSERDFEAIKNLFNTYLAHQGEILLAESLRKTTLQFFDQMSAHYHIKAKKKIIRGPQEEIRVIFAKMRPKP